EHGYVEATCERLKGTEVVFDRVTVTGTENLMMAATLAEGRTILENAAMEPEVVDLADLLKKMGASIQGAGTPKIIIDGTQELKGTTHRVIPDRIETGTFIVAAAITGGELELTDVIPEHVETIIEKLRENGVAIEAGNNRIVVYGPHDLAPSDVSTHEYPGFATDMQAQYMALMTQANGISLINESIFENRYMH